MCNNVFNSDNLCCQYLRGSTIFISILNTGDVKQIVLIDSNFLPYKVWSLGGLAQSYIFYRVGLKN